MVSARRELRCLLELAVPSALSTYCFFAISITELSVVGHLGVDRLAAVAYAQMCLTCPSSSACRASTPA